MKPFSIAGIEIKNRYVSAPLAGYSDYARRRINYDYGAGLLYTERESCEAIRHNSRISKKELNVTRKDKAEEQGARLALQIFGGDANHVLESIPLVEKRADYDFLDFNCGCPAPKVVRQQSGSFWLNRQDELLDLLRQRVRISNHPVIIKRRVGFNEVIDRVSLCKKIEETGVKAICIHARTRKERFSPVLHYDVIKAVKENVSIPIIANGNIGPDNFRDVLNQTNADAVMVATKRIGYPKIFQDRILLEEGQTPFPTTFEGQIRDLEKHLDYIYDTKDDLTASLTRRSIAVHYLKGFENAKSKRNLLVHCKTKKDYLDILQQM